jgi:TRAP-type C4-dicarboxylate transport system permease small subunit
MSLLARIERFAAALAGLAVAAMMLIGLADVLGTNLLGRPVPAAVELTESLMVVAIFLALALSQRQGRQIRVDLISARLSVRGRSTLAIVAALLGALVYSAIGWWGQQALGDSLRSGETSAGLWPFALWPSRAALVAGAGLMSAQCLAEGWQAIRTLRAGADPAAPDAMPGHPPRVH